MTGLLKSAEKTRISLDSTKASGISSEDVLKFITTQTIGVTTGAVDNNPY